MTLSVKNEDINFNDIQNLKFFEESEAFKFESAYDKELLEETNKVLFHHWNVLAKTKSTSIMLFLKEVKCSLLRELISRKFKTIYAQKCSLVFQ